MTDISRIDLNLLVVLDAIYSEGGVTRAAEKLNLTQPAISHALARLRAKFDDPLFVKQGRSLTPTPLTRNLIEPLRRNLRALGDTLSEVRQFDPAHAEARFTLGLRDPVEVMVLPGLMRRIAREAPGIDIVAAQVGRRNAAALLSAGALDLFIDVLLARAEGLQKQLIASNRIVVVARRGHPAIRRNFTLATYMRQQHVMVSSRRKGGGFEDVNLSRLGLERRIRLRCRNHNAALQVVAETDLVLTMAEHYARALNPDFGHQILPLPVEMPTLDLYLYWHASADHDPANRWLRGEVAAAFAGLKRR